MTLAEQLREAVRLLTPHSDSARADAECLLAHVTGCSRSGLIAAGARVLGADEKAAFDALLRRRADGEPIAYLTGSQGFWTLELAVNPQVLVPRPDTEHLVETALELARARSADGSGLRLLDLGTGSGCIALALARELPQAEVIASDRSRAALDAARDNARRLGLERVIWRCGDWFDALPPGEAPFDLVLSNPPYIAADDPHLPARRHAPRSALVAGADGLDDLRRIARAAPRWLRPGGWLAVEHGYAQGDAVRRLFDDAGFAAVETRRDYGGHERLTLGRWP